MRKRTPKARSVPVAFTYPPSAPSAGFASSTNHGARCHACNVRRERPFSGPHTATSAPSGHIPTATDFTQSCESSESIPSPGLYFLDYRYELMKVHKDIFQVCLYITHLEFHSRDPDSPRLARQQRQKAWNKQRRPRTRANRNTICE